MSGNGVILERLSGKKLSILVSILLALQLVFFLIGAFKFPNATHTETVEGIMCRDSKDAKISSRTQNDDEDVYYLRDYLGRSHSNCDRIQVDEHKNVILNANQNEIVYAFQIPLPRDNRVLKLHRFFQTMTSMLQLQVIFPVKLADEDYNETAVSHSIPLNVRLAHHNSDELDDEWHQFANGKFKKNFKCYKNPYSLDCDMLELFELPSVHHEFYVVNIKLGESDMLDTIRNAHLDKIYSVKQLPETRLVLTFIYQTGGFTQMWLLMKSIVFPFVFIIMCWYWNRIVKLERKSNLLERVLFALGLSLTILNIPIEWLTLHYEIKWILLYADLRQGIFYSTLFTFWIIFCGEHFMDENQINPCSGMKSYWKYIGALWTGCVCLLVFDLANRGMQMTDPFFSIWDSQNGTNLANVMLICASLCGILYFGLLLYLVGRVFYNFRTKQGQLPAMSRARRAFYQGIIYRFKFLLVGTVFCAALTVSFFIVNNLNETHWRFSDEPTYFNYNGAFFTGVYGMWNIYVVAVMIFYAPSHKNKPSNVQIYDNQETEETVEFVNLQTRLTSGSTTESVLTQFANKISSS